MASRKNKGLLALMLLYVAAFLIASLLTGSIGESIEGLGRIIAAPSFPKSAAQRSRPWAWSA